jgi:hypothetical protein
MRLLCGSLLVLILPYGILCVRAVRAHEVSEELPSSAIIQETHRVGMGVFPAYNC